MRKKEMKKHSIYFDLLEAMEGKGCPICFLAQKSADIYIRAILNEGVNDPPLRRKLRNSLGFCGGHAGKLRDLGDSLATAILYKDLVDEMAHRIERGETELEVCPACTSEAEAEKDYLVSFCKYLQEEEFLDRYDASSGLCNGHLNGLWKILKDERDREVVLRKETEKLERLSGYLEEYIRKKDYRYSHESPGEERDSWLRAVEKVAGRRS